VTRPHLLVFMTDDHGAWAMPRHGEGLARHLHAPTLAYLADTGTTLTAARTPSPVCSPARASFWAGLLPSAHGVHDWLAESPDCPHPGLTDRHLGQRLRDAGYHTVFAGKWHCGRDHEPHAGFDRWSSLAAGTNARFGPQPFCVDGERVERHGHQAPMIADDAARFLRERPTDRPFFAFVGLTDPHTPLDTQAPARLRHRYRGVGVEPPHDEPADPAHGHPRFPSYADPARHREHLIDYLASVSLVDEQVGRVIDELDSQGELGRTLIVYTADHGHLNGQRGLIGKGNSTLPQNLLEGSLRVPSVWRGPGVAAGATLDLPFDHLDLHATLAAAAGCGGDGLDGLRPGADARAHLAGGGGAAGPWRTYQVCEYGNARAWIDPRWKYIERYPGPNGHFDHELYDMAADPRETTNVYDAEPGVVRRCRQRLEAHFARYERPGRSGRRVRDLPTCNGRSSWEVSPPGGVAAASAAGTGASP